MANTRPDSELKFSVKISGNLPSAVLADLIILEPALATAIIQAEEKQIDVSYQEGSTLLQKALSITTDNLQPNVAIPVTLSVDLNKNDMARLMLGNPKLAIEIIRNKKNESVKLTFAEASEALCIPKESSYSPSRPSLGQEIHYPAQVHVNLPNGETATLKPTHLAILHALEQTNVSLTRKDWQYQRNLKFSGYDGDCPYVGDKYQADLIKMGLIRRVERGVYELNDRAFVTEILTTARASVTGPISAPATKTDVAPY